jgi:hypothetical protein
MKVEQCRRQADDQACNQLQSFLICPGTQKAADDMYMTLLKGIINPNYKMTHWFPYRVHSLWTRYGSNPCSGLVSLALSPHANVLAFVAQIPFKPWNG